MLRDLHVRNLAVLAGAAVEFGAGLNVLTGETGAGKSIVVDSLLLLAGVRANTELIRTGADTLTVTGVFGVAGEEPRQLMARAALDGGEDGEAGADEILVRREVSHSGRNRVLINDQPTTLKLLADLAPHLLRIHGQRDELGLVSPELQRVWLDRRGGAEAADLLARAAAAHDAWSRLAERLARLTGDERQRRERLEMLRFQVGELAAANLRAGEEEELREERGVLRHAEAILRAVGGSLEELFEAEGSAVERLGRSQDLLSGIAAWEPQAAAWDREIEELRVRAEELALTLRRRLDGLEADPGRLDAVEERLAALERLRRKHGAAGVAALLERRRELGEELEELAGDAESLEEIQVRAAAALEEYRLAALDLSAGRRRWGEALAAAVGRELADLGLGKARLEVSLERRRRGDSPLELDGEAVDFGPRGVDQVVFLFAPNPGEEPRPLARVASGGELSRLYLALQLAALGDAGEVGEGEAAGPTLVFDEVDTGIGGAEAAALGRKLQRLAAGRQILAVTHLPQVASHGDVHFKVEKSVRGGRTHVEVRRLDAEERVEEVARMLAGTEVTDLSLSHARELLAGAARSAAAAGAAPAGDSARKAGRKGARRP